MSWDSNPAPHTQSTCPHREDRDPWELDHGRILPPNASEGVGGTRGVQGPGPAPDHRVGQGAPALSPRPPGGPRLLLMQTSTPLVGFKLGARTKPALRPALSGEPSTRKEGGQEERARPVASGDEGHGIQGPGFSREFLPWQIFPTPPHVGLVFDTNGIRGRKGRVQDPLS